MKNSRLLFVIATLVACGHVASAAEHSFPLTLEAGKVPRSNSPVSVLIEVPQAVADCSQATVEWKEGSRLPAQVTAPSLLAAPGKASDGKTWRELHFILPELAAGTQHRVAVKMSPDANTGSPAFSWSDTAGEYAELSFGAEQRRPVLRYMYKKLDESSKEARERTFKVYHHLYDPTGKQLVTKGPGGLYTHHRGLFYGFNKVTYGDKKTADVWHCTGDAHLSHEGFLAQESGPVLGRHRVAIDWHGQNKEVFAKEEREMTVYNAAGGTLVEFASRVRPVISPVRLDGDPQHAGFHFRAGQEVAESTKSQTYYLRPDGKDKAGATRNWPANKEHVNLPWNAMCFVLGDVRYTALYLDRPSNPKEARFSERDYGRFGSYFEYDLTPEKPLEVNYRVLLKVGEFEGATAAATDADFDHPVTTK